MSDDREQTEISEEEAVFSVGEWQRHAMSG